MMSYPESVFILAGHIKASGWCKIIEGVVVLSIVQAVVYGIVQGITEFLPVSSTAHLDLMPWILGWQQPRNVFDVALHFGTALAVITFFFKNWISLNFAADERTAFSFQSS